MAIVVGCVLAAVGCTISAFSVAIGYELPRALTTLACMLTALMFACAAVLIRIVVGLQDPDDDRDFDPYP